jgi:hypothetical protein
LINRPIEEIFGFLADGEIDPKFTPKVLEITKKTDAAPGAGTINASGVKDAGLKTERELKITESRHRPGFAGRNAQGTSSRRPRAATTSHPSQPHPAHHP